MAIAASGGWQPRFTTVKAVRFAIAVTDFDQLDNSGEPPNRRRAHKTGLADFPRSLRPDLKGGGDFRVVTPSLAASCGARRGAPPADLTARQWRGLDGR